MISDQAEPATLVYVVCATPRSGSTHLCEALAGLSEAGAPAEWFGPSMIHKRAREWGIATLQSTMDSPDLTDGSSYINHVRTHAQRNGVLAFKVHWDQIDWCRTNLGIHPLQVVSGLPEVKYVRIYREDIIGQTVSSFIASATKVFSVRAGQRIKPNDEFETDEYDAPDYDFNELLLALGHVAASEFGWAPYFESEGIIPYELSYEELDRDLTATVHGVMDYLGVAPHNSIKSPLLKLRTDVNRVYGERFLHDLESSGVLDRLSEGLRRRCLAHHDSAH